MVESHKRSRSRETMRHPAMFASNLKNRYQDSEPGSAKNLHIFNALLAHEESTVAGMKLVRSACTVEIAT